MKFNFILITSIITFLSTCILNSDETNSISEIRQQLQKLKAENEALKIENQVLRKLVFERQSTPQTQPAPTPSTSVATPTQSAPPPQSPVRVAPSKPSAAVEYWITTSSGKRHNSGCRYFGTSRGRPGASNEGTACKICGG